MTSLPNNWVLARVDDVVIMAPRNYLDDDLEVGFIPLNLLGTRFNEYPSFEKRKWREVKQGFTHLADGDVVLAKITPSFENGKAGVVRDLPHGVGAGSTEYFVCRPVKGGVEPEFLLAFLKTKAFTSGGKRQMSGAVGQQRVPKEYLASSQIPLPPIAEQKKLVRKLHHTFRAADKCVSDAIKLEQRADRFEKRMLDAAILGALTTEWRKLQTAVEPGEVLKTRVIEEQFASPKRPKNAPEVVAGGDAEGLDLALPNSWCWLVGSEVVAPGADIVYGIVQPGPQQQDGVPYIRGMDIEGGVILLNQLAKTTPEIAERYSRSALAPGDVLLGIIRATKVAIVPTELNGANITQGTSRFRPSKFILSEYLAIVLRSPFVQRWLHDHFRGIDMPGLNLADVRRVPVPLPPIEEQREIVLQVEKHQRTAHSIKNFANALTRRARYIEQAILDKAFRGELITASARGKAVRLDQVRLSIDSELRAEQARRKSWRTRPVKKITLDSIKEVIRSLPDATFTAEELRREIEMDYEPFKEFLFAVLSEPAPLIEQYFDTHASGIYLRKVNS